MSRGNQLLSSLPEDDYRRISPYMRHTTLHARQMLQRQGQPVQHIVFPVAGVCSAGGRPTWAPDRAARNRSRRRHGPSVVWADRGIDRRGRCRLPTASACRFRWTCSKRGTSAAAHWPRSCRILPHVDAPLMQASACNACIPPKNAAAAGCYDARSHASAQLSNPQDLLAMALGVRRPP